MFERGVVAVVAVALLDVVVAVVAVASLAIVGPLFAFGFPSLDE